MTFFAGFEEWDVRVADVVVHGRSGAVGGAAARAPGDAHDVAPRRLPGPARLRAVVGAAALAEEVPQELAALLTGRFAEHRPAERPGA
ncbi:hypothetical protein [Cellulomonas sp. JZ18]|uniref:hypothetical protein n=1 Tax=Cellulomonas sp. JZ18 TaxID=2654191 RepID=UPI00351BC82A